MPLSRTPHASGWKPRPGWSSWPTRARSTTRRGSSSGPATSMASAVRASSPLSRSSAILSHSDWRPASRAGGQSDASDRTSPTCRNRASRIGKVSVESVKDPSCWIFANSARHFARAPIADWTGWESTREMPSGAAIQAARLCQESISPQTWSNLPRQPTDPLDEPPVQDEGSDRVAEFRPSRKGRTLPQPGGRLLLGIAQPGPGLPPPGIEQVAP